VTAARLSLVARQIAARSTSASTQISFAPVAVDNLVLTSCALSLNQTAPRYQACPQAATHPVQPAAAPEVACDTVHAQPGMWRRQCPACFAANNLSARVRASRRHTSPSHSRRLGTPCALPRSMRSGCGSTTRRLGRHRQRWIGSLRTSRNRGYRSRHNNNQTAMAMACCNPSAVYPRQCSAVLCRRYIHSHAALLLTDAGHTTTMRVPVREWFGAECHTYGYPAIHFMGRGKEALAAATLAGSHRDEPRNTNSNHCHTVKLAGSAGGGASSSATATEGRPPSGSHSMASAMSLDTCVRTHDSPPLELPGALSSPNSMISRCSRASSSGSRCFGSGLSSATMTRYLSSPRAAA